MTRQLQGDELKTALQISSTPDDAWCPIDKNEGVVKREVFLGGAQAPPGPAPELVVRTKTLEHDSLLTCGGTTRSTTHRYGFYFQP